FVPLARIGSYREASLSPGARSHPLVKIPPISLHRGQAVAFGVYPGPRWKMGAMPYRCGTKRYKKYGKIRSALGILRDFPRFPKVPKLLTGVRFSSPAP